MKRLLFSTIAIALAACPSTTTDGTDAPQPAAMPAMPAPTTTSRVDVSKLVDEARTLREQGDTTGARAKLDEAIAAQPTNGLAVLERAELLLDAGEDVELASKDAANAVALLPDNPRARKVQARTYEDAGDLTAALVAYERALALRPEPSLQRKVASLSSRAGDVGRATQLWEELAAADPKDVGAQVELATLYEKQDRLASAENAYRHAVQLQPANVGLRRRFAEFLDRQGKAKEAREQRRLIDEASPTTRDERKLRELPKSAR